MPLWPAFAPSVREMRTEDPRMRWAARSVDLQPPAWGTAMSTSLNEGKPSSSRYRRCRPDLVEHGSVDEFVREEHGVPRRLLGGGGGETGVYEVLPAIRAVNPRRGLDETLVPTIAIALFR